MLRGRHGQLQASQCILRLIRRQVSLFLALYRALRKTSYSYHPGGSAELQFWCEAQEQPLARSCHGGHGRDAK